MTEYPPGPPWGGYPPGPPSGNYPPPPPGGGYPPSGPSGYGQKPDTTLYLVWSIFVLACCCLPFGIISLIKVNQVGSLWAQGAYAEAQKAYADARMWALWGTIIGFFVGIVYIILMALGVFGPMLGSESGS